MKLFITSLFIFMGFLSVTGQKNDCSHSIQGQILDIETKEPIPYVFIKVKGKERYGYTDINGYFNIEGLCKTNNTLIISCSGYCNSVCKDYHQHGKSPHIFLTQNVHQLNNITIHAKSSHQEGIKTISQNTLGIEKIRKNPTQSLASLVATENGVSYISSGSNVQSPVIHGLYGNRILILNNGIKHGFQNWGTDHAPEISIANANDITIIKGAAGVRYGPEALGGVVNIKPNPLYLNNPLYTEVGIGTQTNGKGVFTNIKVGVGLKKWSYFLNGNITKIGDLHSPDYSLTNSGKEEKSVGFGTRYYHKEFDFKVYYSYLNQNLALLRSSIADSGNAFVNAINANEPNFIEPFSYEINEPNQKIAHHFFKGEMNWTYANEGKLTFIVGQQINKRQEFDVRRNEEKPIIDLDLITSEYQLEWKHPDWYRLEGIIGIQFFNQDNDNNTGTGTTPLIPNYNTNSFSAFIIESKDYKKNTFELGIRLDYRKNDVRGRETNQDIFRDQYRFKNLTFSLGYVRGISENSSFRTNIGTAWRTPNMMELYGFGQHGFKTTYGLLRYYTNENGELKTDKVIPMEESSVAVEKGYKLINEYKYTTEKSSFATTVYAHYIKNYIYDRPIAVIGTLRGPMPVYIQDQANAAFIGLDFSWKQNWSNQLSGVFGFSYLWSKNIEKNEALINQPPITSKYALTWTQHEFWKFDTSQLTVKPSYTFQQHQAPRTVSPEDLIDGSVIITTDTEIFDFKDAPKGYFLVDLEYNFSIKNTTASIAVKNLLNTSYRNYLNEMRYFANEPGINFLFTLNYSF